MTDMHTHSIFSGDARSDPESMVLSAIEKGCRRLAFTEHANFDFDLHGIIIPPTDHESYAASFPALQEKYRGKIELVFGIEAGYDPALDGKYRALIEKYKFGHIINSVHLIAGEDCYREGFFKKYAQKTAYTNYLKAVRASLDANFPFDTLGHFGYVTRYGNFESRDIFDDYTELVDDILKTVIQKGVALEVNSNIGKAPPPCLPEYRTVTRYRELGGELITYGSDAHSAGDLLRGRDTVMEMLTAAGFKYHTVFENNQPKQLKI